LPAEGAAVDLDRPGDDGVLLAAVALDALMDRVGPQRTCWRVCSFARAPSCFRTASQLSSHSSRSETGRRRPKVPLTCGMALSGPS
jgi:hypothetical protein